MEPDADARILLGVLLDEPLRHFAESELVALLDWPNCRVQDAVADLARDGLARRQGDFVFTSRAAVRGSALAP